MTTENNETLTTEQQKKAINLQDLIYVKKYISEQLAAAKAELEASKEQLKGDLVNGTVVVKEANKATYDKNGNDITTTYRTYMSEITIDALTNPGVAGYIDLHTAIVGGGQDPVVGINLGRLLLPGIYMVIYLDSDDENNAGNTIGVVRYWYKKGTDGTITDSPTSSISNINAGVSRDIHFKMWTNTSDKHTMFTLAEGGRDADNYLTTGIVQFIKLATLS